MIDPYAPEEGPIYTLRITEAALNALVRDLRRYGFEASWSHWGGEATLSVGRPPQKTLPQGKPYL